MGASLLTLAKYILMRTQVYVMWKLSSASVFLVSVFRRSYCIFWIILQLFFGFARHRSDNSRGFYKTTSVFQKVQLKTN